MNWFPTYDRKDEGDEEHGVDLCRNEGEEEDRIYVILVLVIEYRYLMKHSTQHTAHSTKHGVDF